MFLPSNNKNLSYSNPLIIARPIHRGFMLNLMLLISAACIGLMFYFSGHRNADVASAPPPSNNRPAYTNSVTAAQQTQDVNNVATQALAFYNMLSASQQSALQLMYSTTLARKWSNLPCGASCRNGLQLGTNLDAAQYAAAMQVVKAALSQTPNNGYDEFHQMNLAEAYLHANGGGNGYDSTLRWMAFLNTPSATGAWMLQFGGHHYAANIAFNNGHVIGATPFFMGLEPKTFVWQGVTYDPLGDERDSLRALFATLTSAQLSSAVISQTFSDCVMIPGETNGGTSTFPSYTIGQSLGSLTTVQQNMALAVIREYVGDMDSATATNVMAGYTNDIAQTYISYHGNGSSGNPTSFLVAQGDYMRISGPDVWVEFSCQGGIVIPGQIHYHTVWRDRSHDYGVDLTGPAIDGTSTSIASVTGDANGDIVVYPNPSNSVVTLHLPAPATDANAALYNAASGQLMKQIEHISGSLFVCDMTGYAAGTYVMRVQSAGKIYATKISKR